MSVSWLSPPRRIELHQGEAHVWFCDFSGVVDFATASRVLSTAELERAARFRSDESRLTFVSAHCFLRWILGTYLEIPAAHVAFGSEVGGKPCLDRGMHATDLHFNLSHSHRSAACAIARAPVGIDIERPDPRLCELATAELVFSAEELGRLQAFAPTERVEAFFLGWTKKEAYAKCKGIGLTADWKSINLGFVDGNSNFKGISLSTFACPNNDAAALALTGTLETMALWEVCAESWMP